MALRSLIVAVALVAVSALGLQGCNKDAQKVQPETRGQRGETCLARNDCDTGLACINNTCAKNEFNLDVTAKQCIREECTETADCCGDKLTEAPAKCDGRHEICEVPTIAGCSTTATCTTANAATVCGGGTCNPGTCSGSFQTGTACETATDCPKNVCITPAGSVTGSCSLSAAFCDAATPCATYTATCSTRRCNCLNPVYNTSDPICTDTDCDDICLLRCQDNLCLEDKSCKTDDQCLALGFQVCDGGRCVECTTKADCDEENEETCESGKCRKPCKANEECPLFAACVKGDCVYQGCNDDRECILAASRGLQGVGGTSNAQAAGADDPRLYKCLANDADPDHKTCKIPCENDGSCGQFQVCDEGYCKFVGCDSDEQCRNYLGIANQMTSEVKPYVAKAKCVDPADAVK
jgi:hypothetical protein